MDIGKSFGYVFDDDEWITKLLIAAGILLLGIFFFWLLIPSILAGLLLGGYGIEITRRVIRGDAEVLPKWDNWGELLVDGLKGWIIEIIYALPIIVLGVCLSIPLGILSEEAQEVGALLSVCLSGIYILWGIVMGFLLPAAIAMFVAEEEVSAAFRFGDVFDLVRGNFVTYLLVLVIGWVASFIGGLGLLVCGVGVLVTAPYAGWITAHIRGQAYLEAKGQTAQPALEEEFA
jgi:hypothetical protein